MVIRPPPLTLSERYYKPITEQLEIKMEGVPRYKLMALVKRVIREEGPLTHHKLVRELAQRGELYVMMAGDKEAVSAYAMKRQLRASSEVVQNDEGEWEISGFAMDDNSGVMEAGSKKV